MIVTMTIGQDNRSSSNQYHSSCTCHTREGETRSISSCLIGCSSRIPFSLLSCLYFHILCFFDVPELFGDDFHQLLSSLRVCKIQSFFSSVVLATNLITSYSSSYFYCDRGKLNMGLSLLVCRNCNSSYCRRRGKRRGTPNGFDRLVGLPNPCRFKS